MSINFTCPACSNDISMEDEWAGQRVKCPNCHETVPVPGVGLELVNPEHSPPHGADTMSNQYGTPTMGPYAVGSNHISASVLINNSYAKAGFIVALISMPTYFIGIIPLAAIILSGIGIANFDPEKHNNKWMAGWGLGIGIVMMVMSIAFWRGGLGS